MSYAGALIVFGAHWAGDQPSQLLVAKVVVPIFFLVHLTYILRRLKHELVIKINHQP